MTSTEIFAGELIDDAGITLDQMVCLCAVSREWVLKRVEERLLPAASGAADGWRFSSRTVWRARRMHALERDFDADPELAALAADLMEELERMRMRLRAAGLA